MEPNELTLEIETDPLSFATEWVEETEGRGRGRPTLSLGPSE